jgi:cation diffusion facilitator CzcD-associated flavoprotein CzcO
LSTRTERSQYAEQPIADHVCVIGAGISGLAVAGVFRSRGLPFTLVERSGGVGGLWRHAGTGEPGPGYPSLHLNTSRKVTGYGDFPMPDHYPRFPRHDQVSAYLQSYAQHIGLNDVEFDTEVISVSPLPDATWQVVTEQRSTGTRRSRRFRHVVVATGHHWNPSRAAIPGADSFPGRHIHSFDYSGPAEHVGGRALVVGFGNSAADIAVELSRLASKTFITLRRGIHVVPKQMMGIPIDEIASAKWWARMPFEQQRRFIELLLRIIRGPLSSYGIPEPDHRIFSSALTISDELLSRIDHGDITVKAAVERIDGSTVRFADGTSEEVDTIISCTGYRISFPFLPDDCVFTPSGQVGLYRRVVPPQQRGLYLAGLIRPVGSITRLVEGQARWIADLVAGVADLPPVEVMQGEVRDHLAATNARYGTTPGNSIQVDFAPYLESLAVERRDRSRAASTSRHGVEPVHRVGDESDEDGLAGFPVARVAEHDGNGVVDVEGTTDLVQLVGVRAVEAVHSDHERNVAALEEVD